MTTFAIYWNELFQGSEHKDLARLIIPIFIIVLLSVPLVAFALQSQKRKAVLKVSPEVVKTPQPRTWRIRLIPIGVSKTELLSQLDAGPKDIQKLTLAPVSQRHSCATITCLYKPNPKDAAYRVDEDFFGVTPLDAPTSASVE